MGIFAQHDGAANIRDRKATRQQRELVWLWICVAYSWTVDAWRSSIYNEWQQLHSLNCRSLRTQHRFLDTSEVATYSLLFCPLVPGFELNILQVPDILLSSARPSLTRSSYRLPRASTAEKVPLIPHFIWTWNNLYTYCTGVLRNPTTFHFQNKLRSVFWSLSDRRRSSPRVSGANSDHSHIYHNWTMTQQVIAGKLLRGNRRACLHNRWVVIKLNTILGPRPSCIQEMLHIYTPEHLGWYWI